MAKMCKSKADPVDLQPQGSSFQDPKHTKIRMNDTLPCFASAEFLRKRNTLHQNICRQLELTWGQTASALSREEFLLEHMPRKGDQLMDQLFIVDFDTLLAIQDEMVAKYIIAQASACRHSHPGFFRSKGRTCAQVTLLPSQTTPAQMRFAVTILSTRYIGEEGSHVKMVARPGLRLAPPGRTPPQLQVPSVWATDHRLSF